MKKVAVLLSGCGVFDGAEIHESVITLLCLDRAGAKYQVIAPDKPQVDVINHVTQAPSSETRSVMVESARIARGDVLPLSKAFPVDYDAVILPGGFGAAKNLCDFATAGVNCTIDPEVEAFLASFRDDRKPAGYICIAPAIAAKLYPGARLTIGSDPETAEKLTKMGGNPIDCSVSDVVVDHDARLVSTPAYMLAERISEAEAGIYKLVETLLDMC